MSHLAWSGPEEDVAAVRSLHRELQQRGKPHFRIGDPLLANELLVPTLPWDYFKRLAMLESSMPMTIWAVIDAVDITALHDRLGKASIETTKLSSGLILRVARFE